MTNSSGTSASDTNAPDPDAGDPKPPLRIGALGAARITPQALVKPAKDLDEVEVVAVAARHRGRGEKYAAKHGVPVVHESYDALIADPDIDAIYNPLPNGLHGKWTIAALEAGKHVLCEKPFTANADEARTVADVAAKHPELVVMEAFHYRYHPLIPRLLQIVGTELGEVHRIETRMCIPLPMRKDIRFQLDLAGGALMDTGCYAVHQLRTLAGAEPTVVSADVKLRSEQVDRWAKAELRFDDGRTGTAECALWSSKLLSIGAEVTGSRGTLRVFNMTGPQYYHRVTVKSRDPRSGKVFKRREKVDGKATYWYQLQAFAQAVAGDAAANLTPPADSIANMEIIDAIYRAAGLAPRDPTP